MLRSPQIDTPPASIADEPILQVSDEQRAALSSEGEIPRAQQELVAGGSGASASTLAYRDSAHAYPVGNVDGVVVGMFIFGCLALIMAGSLGAQAGTTTTLRDPTPEEIDAALIKSGVSDVQQRVKLREVILRMPDLKERILAAKVDRTAI